MRMTGRVSGRKSTVVRADRRDLCLDFINTLCWRGSASPSESLHGIGDVLEWCTANGAIEADAARAGWWSKHAKEAATAFAEAIALRETLCRIFVATTAAPLTGTGEARAADLAAFNRWLDAAPARRRLRRAGDG